MKTQNMINLAMQEVGKELLEAQTQLRVYQQRISTDSTEVTEALTAIANCFTWTNAISEITNDE